MNDDSNPKDRLGALKPQLHLFPAAALVYGAKVMELGARKYGPMNWRSKKVRFTVYVSAAMRHLLEAVDGQDLDDESHQPHMAHALACCAIVLDALATGNLIDDRPPKGAAGRLIADLTEKAAMPTAPDVETRATPHLGIPRIHARNDFGVWIPVHSACLIADRRHQGTACDKCREWLAVDQFHPFPELRL